MRMTEESEGDVTEGEENVGRPMLRPMVGAVVGFRSWVTLRIRTPDSCEAGVT